MLIIFIKYRQVYVAKLQWVDFVVWFEPETDIFVERIYFNSDMWFENCLPKLDFFYKLAFVPKLLTRRVKRKISAKKPGLLVKHKCTCF